MPDKRRRVVAMKVNIKDFLHECGVEETLYPGKRHVKRLPQTGENKSHCVVYDWRNPDLLKMEIKAGLGGSDLTKKELARYPLSFQSPTFVEIATSHDHNDESGDEEGEKSGGGGGGHGMKHVGNEKALNAFSKVVDGRIPGLGEVRRLVIMGKEIAREAFSSVLKALTAQIRTLTVAPVNLLASVTNVTRIAPGGRLLEDVDANLLKGDVKRYTPKDMFGVPGPG